MIVVDSGFVVKRGIIVHQINRITRIHHDLWAGNVHRGTLRYHWAHQYHGRAEKRSGAVRGRNSAAGNPAENPPGGRESRADAERWAGGNPGRAATRAGRTNAAPTQWVGAAFTLSRLRAGD
jgi:hypothetical protein